ncbi:hypothetical protein [Micromonospora halophytica]|uniref:Uncharacterized protein n=1 Tax=Micromonospora halophytica TaxID=47864 RepID=A0A1C5IKK1_9ACTN|nr:hypothetical protein [Micromonospora halophytica]SCG58857.1 hypothetical protein GA0070560_11317 [Micromonospora halophytica]
MKTARTGRRLPEMSGQREDDGVVVLTLTEPASGPDQESAVLEAVGLCPGLR